MPTRDIVLIVLLTIVGMLVLRLLIGLILSGGDVRRMRLAVAVGFRTLRDREFADRVAVLLEPPPPAKPSGAPLRFLTLLQREGRLIDFLLEDVQAFSNEQIGAAVREVHAKCRHALQEHLDLEPVIAQPEESTVQVAAGFDPSAIQLTGNVTGQPPFRGTLKHHGWRVREIKLAPPPEGVDEFVLQPAEVELP